MSDALPPTAAQNLMRWLKPTKESVLEQWNALQPLRVEVDALMREAETTGQYNAADERAHDLVQREADIGALAILLLTSEDEHA